MAKFDRSKFKTSNSLATQEIELAKIIKQGNSSSTPGMIELKEDGDYLLRFWPTPVEDSYFMLPYVVHFLDMELDKWDKDTKSIITDSNGDPVKEVRKGTVFNSRVHGGTEKDIIEEYISRLEASAEEMYGDDLVKRKDYLKHMIGYGSGKNYTGGIREQVEYHAYASLLQKNNNGDYVEKEFGRVKLKPSIRKKMLALSSSGDGDNGLSIDPFSDPDDGFIVKVTRDSVAGKKDPGDWYKVAWCNKNFIPIKWPLPEGFESKFDEMPTLDELYKNKYTEKDFSNAMDGLQRFDSKHSYNIFSYDDFLDTCEEISAYYPEEGEESSTEQEPEQTSVKSKTEQKDLPFEVEEKKIGGLSASEKLAQMKAKLSGN